MESTNYGKNFMIKYTNKNSDALRHLTSKQFFEVWSNYDQDGNGYIEGRELDNFLQEFVTSICDDKEPLDERLLQELKKAFMDAYDNNHDGRIDIRELAQLLPLEESFKLLFKFENQVDSSVEFMRIWTKYDTDASGFIDAQELRDFLRDLLNSNHLIGGAGSGVNSTQTGSAAAAAATTTTTTINATNKTARRNISNKNSLGSVDEDKLDEYTETLLKIFDSNKDGKLQLNEMTKLLLVKENFLQCSGIFHGSNKRLDKADIERIFTSYDRDANGVIENEELSGFIKDLMDFLGKMPDTKDIDEFQRMVMDGCDANGDGKINKKELTTVLLALAKYASEEEKQQQQQQTVSTSRSVLQEPTADE